jgi:hypothetical protein
MTFYLIKPNFLNVLKQKKDTLILLNCIKTIIFLRLYLKYFFIKPLNFV